jgi:plastocyanin
MMHCSGRASRRFVVLPVAIAAVSLGPAFAVEPGIDIAAPRVAISTVDGVSVAFHPRRLVVEQDDYVRWRWTGAAHTTTSGEECGLPDGLWSSPLSSAVTSFTRLFDDDPATYPYFCSPHCGLGMTGQVVVTAAIPLFADVPSPGTDIRLSWSGGDGIFRVFRSSGPLFAPGTTTELTGANGTTALTFVDTSGSVPPAGGAFFYLVMNWFSPL